jgi:biotin carboxylase
VICPALHISRQSLQSVAAGEKSVSDIADDHAFPIILRPVGSHGGHGLQKVDNREAVASYLQQTTRIRFLVAFRGLQR